MRFEFATAGRVVFGTGAVAGVGTIAAGLGRRALVVTGRHGSAGERVLDLVGGAGVATSRLIVSGEPTTATALDAVAAGREHGCDVVVAVGGGSVLDTGKAAAAIIANGGDPLDYLEVVGAGRPLARPSLPVVAVPTTAGTGSEVTRNAVLVSARDGVKASLRSHFMLPAVALVDPDLTLDLPPEITASTGLDALTQLIEPFVCVRPHPMVDFLCRDGIARAARSLRRACEDGRDAGAREDMCLASLYGGMALANAALGAVHGFAAVVGGLFRAPHGAVCARLLAPAIEVNVRALAERVPGSPVLVRYDEVGRLLTGRQDAVAADAVAWVDSTCQSLRIPALSAYGLGDADVAAVVEKAAAASSTRGNPIQLTRDEMEEVLRQAM